MRHVVTRIPRHPFLKHPLGLSAALLACVLVMVFAPSIKSAMAAVAVASVAIHVGAAAALHLGGVLAAVGVLLAALRAHARTHGGDREGPGATIRWARSYDWAATAHFLGREGRMRERTLDVAEVAVGERVLDVGCGTGTLALAAKMRVGPQGTVHGVDASAEMIARARTKSAQDGLPVEFELAAAQALPFPDATFDVVLCTLAMHHVPEDARASALAELRRVLKPGGRALIVEFARERGLRAALHPMALLHARRNPRLVDELTEGMRRSGFERVVSGALGFGGLDYVLARRESDSR